LKTNIKSFPNRAEFAHAMIDKYFGQAPNNIVSDIGARALRQHCIETAWLGYHRIRIGSFVHDVSIQFLLRLLRCTA